LKRTGKKNVPFTTGILIGIGETREERLEALREINLIHQEYGHIQEVIIQNFQSKPDIEMALHPEPSLTEMLWTIANARLILDADISIQAPPNLSERHIDYLKAGINDWGGISPVTIDFINPQHDWPEIRELMEATSKAGHILKERLTVYPSFFKNTSKYLHPGIFDRVSKMAGHDGLSKDQACEVA
jgi:FO synthase